MSEHDVDQYLAPLHKLVSDLMAERDALRAVAEAVDAHYSASLDYQPAYVRMAREALGDRGSGQA
jgi:hypothetical protein